MNFGNDILTALLFVDTVERTWRYPGLVDGDGDKPASSLIACASALLHVLKIPYVAQGFEGVSISLMSNLQVRRSPIDYDLANANRADKVCRSNDKMQNDALAKRPRDEDCTPR
jgi:hypothetical protein